MTDNSPFDAFRQTTPLADNLPTDSVDEFLDRINEDLIAGAPERITDERLAKLIELYRAQAIDLETKQRDKPARKTPAERKRNVAEALDLDIDIL